jgi:hypothetical protein
MMKDPEEAIEKVLAGLRRTSAPIGMDRRIMEALETRASGQSRWGWQRWPLASLRPDATPFTKWSVGVSVVCVVVLTVTANHRLTHVDSPPKRISSSVAAIPDVASAAAANSSQATPFRLDVPRVKATKPDRKGSVRKAGVADDNESLAVEEMRAASQPPPPMPLTEQERLLLRIAHKDDPVEVAALNPATRAAQYEEEKAEVQRFFKSARLGDNE